MYIKAQVKESFLSANKKRKPREVCDMIRKNEWATFKGKMRRLQEPRSRVNKMSPSYFRMPELVLSIICVW